MALEPPNYITHNSAWEETEDEECKEESENVKRVHVRCKFLMLYHKIESTFGSYKRSKCTRCCTDSSR